jgi:hypothetical protein
MVSSGMLRRVVLVRTDVSEEPSASFIPEDTILHNIIERNGFSECSNLIFISGKGKLSFYNMKEYN